METFIKGKVASGFYATEVIGDAIRRLAQQQCWHERAAHLECIGGSLKGVDDLCTRLAAFAHRSTAVKPEFALVRPLALRCEIYSI